MIFRVTNFLRLFLACFISALIFYSFFQHKIIGSLSMLCFVFDFKKYFIVYVYAMLSLILKNIIIFAQLLNCFPKISESQQ